MYLNTDVYYNLDIHQKLALTPKIQQSLHILSMNNQELSEYINQQALENPVVEIEPAFEELDPDEKFQRKMEWISNADPQNRIYNSFSQDNEEYEYSPVSSDEDSLQKMLLMQLNTLKLNPMVSRAAKYIIQSLDSRGYLEASLKDISRLSGVKPELVLKALRCVQNMEPWGVGARNLKECLMIQLKKKGVKDKKVYCVVMNFLDELSKNKLKVIAEKLDIPVEEVKKIHLIIRSLNPSPGTSYGNTEPISYIYPDITVVKFKDYYEVLLNDFAYPSIRINNTYKELMNSKDSNTREYVSRKIEQAMFLMKCIAQRNKTLLDVAKTIVEIQKNFMNLGPGNLAPMVLGDVASKLGLHESTVSRAIRGKYMQCVWGIYELKYFFSQAIGSSESFATTQENIKLLIKEIIQNEDKKKPLSDQKVADELNKQGISISRRTVTKYREELQIPCTAARKEL